MKAELSQVLRDAGYANAAEFFTELLRCVRRSGSMRRLARYGRKNVLGRRLKRRGMDSIMGMFRRLKEEEHVSSWRITKFGNPLLFIAK